VAEDDLVLSFLEDLPAPNANQTSSSRPPATSSAHRGPRVLALISTDMPVKLAAVLRARRTQTNEAARCALFLPVLAALPQPLALLEVGAAAGLTLPARYRMSYDYEGDRVTGSTSSPTLPCGSVSPAPLATPGPQVYGEKVSTSTRLM